VDRRGTALVFALVDFFYVKLICLDGFSVSTSWLRCKSSTTVSIKVKFKSNNWKSALVAYACVNMFES